MVLTMKIQNLQQNNGLLLTVIQKVIIQKMTLKIFNQIYRIKPLWLFWCILVTGDITAAPNNAVTLVVFKTCAPFKDFRTEINDTFVDYADFINIIMPVNNLIEYSDNYSDTSGSLWDFKRD